MNQNWNSSELNIKRFFLFSSKRVFSSKFRAPKWIWGQIFYRIFAVCDCRWKKILSRSISVLSMIRNLTVKRFLFYGYITREERKKFVNSSDVGERGNNISVNDVKTTFDCSRRVFQRTCTIIANPVNKYKALIWWNILKVTVNH